MTFFNYGILEKYHVLYSTSDKLVTKITPSNMCGWGYIISMACLNSSMLLWV